MGRATAIRAASLAGGRVPERTNGPVSKTVEAFCVSVGSNPTPSANGYRMMSLKRSEPVTGFGPFQFSATLLAAFASGRHGEFEQVVVDGVQGALIHAVAGVLIGCHH